MVRSAEQGQRTAALCLLEAEPQLAAQRTRAGLLPVQLALRKWHHRVARALLSGGDYFSLAAPADARLATDLLQALGEVWDPSSPLYARLAAHRALTAQQWQLVPAPCPGVAPALPAVLARSPSEAACLVARLPAADRARLQAALLALHRAQRTTVGVELPQAMLPALLAGVCPAPA